MFAMVFKCFLVIFVNVLDGCFKCFIFLPLYVATVAFRDFKSRSGVLHMGCAEEAADSADDVRGDAGDVRDRAGPLLVRSLASPTH
jgi:hypothetical protein